MGNTLSGLQMIFSLERTYVLLRHHRVQTKQIVFRHHRKSKLYSTRIFSHPMKKLSRDHVQPQLRLFLLDTSKVWSANKRPLFAALNFQIPNFLKVVAIQQDNYHCCKIVWFTNINETTYLVPEVLLQVDWVQLQVEVWAERKKLSFKNSPSYIWLICQKLLRIYV